MSDSPSVIFSVKKEISAHNSDTHSYDGENHEHKEHKTKHIVDLVRPEGCEDEIPVVYKEIRKYKQNNKKITLFPVPQVMFTNTSWIESSKILQQGT